MKRLDRNTTDVSEIKSERPDRGGFGHVQRTDSEYIDGRSPIEEDHGGG